MSDSIMSSSVRLATTLGHVPSDFPIFDAMH